MFTKSQTLSALNTLCNLPPVGENPLILIAGPCQLESASHSLTLAGQIQEITNSLQIPYIFKGSFDKANRTSINSERGVGIDAGKKIFNTVSSELNIPTLTDIHTPEQAHELKSIVDIMQIPAFLCRQTDLLVAAGKHAAFVNIKKGQFLHPADLQYAAEKVQSGGASKILLTERGSCFGYRELVVDMRSLVTMRALGFPVVFDGTHSVQSMGGAGGSSSGSREFIPPLTKAATAVGIDLLFLEVHEKPDTAPSDGANMLPLSELKALLSQILKVHHSILR